MNSSSCAELLWFSGRLKEEPGLLSDVGSGARSLRAEGTLRHGSSMLWHGSEDSEKEVWLLKERLGVWK